MNSRMVLSLQANDPSSARNDKIDMSFSSKHTRCEKKLLACYLNLAEKPAGLGDVFLETIESMSATKSMMIFQVALEQNRNSKAGKYFTPSKVWNHLNISERTSFRKYTFWVESTDGC